MTDFTELTIDQLVDIVGVALLPDVYGPWELRDEHHAFTELVRRAKAPTYPATPVDCLISELRDEFTAFSEELALADFEKRVAQFKAEVAT